MTGTDGSTQGPDLLGIYLNDHLVGATMGTELARRMAGGHRDPAQRATLRGLATDVAEDRRALLRIMAALGVPVRSYKVYAAWLAEKAGRLKLNGSLLTRSPLSDLLELEMMRLGVEGKAAGWRTLRVLAGERPQLDAAQLDRLLARAGQQVELLEKLRMQTAAHALRSDRVITGELR